MKGLNLHSGPLCVDFQHTCLYIIVVKNVQHRYNSATRPRLGSITTHRAHREREPPSENKMARPWATQWARPWGMSWARTWEIPTAPPKVGTGIARSSVRGTRRCNYTWSSRSLRWRDSTDRREERELALH